MLIENNVPTIYFQPRAYQRYSLIIDLIYLKKIQKYTMNY